MTGAAVSVLRQAEPVREIQSSLLFALPGRRPHLRGLIVQAGQRGLEDQQALVRELVQWGRQGNGRRLTTRRGRG